MQKYINIIQIMQFICIITGFLLSSVVVSRPSSVLTIILYKTILLYYPTLDLCFPVMRGSHHPTTRNNHRSHAYCLGIQAARLYELLLV